MNYSDREYIESKRIKKLKLGVNPLFRFLAIRLEEYFDLTVINIFYESLLHNKSPRLYVVYESFEKWAKSVNSNTSYLSRQDIYREIFYDEFPDQKNDKLFFIDSPFDSVNINEVFVDIDDSVLELSIKPLINNYWRIYPFGRSLNVFCLNDIDIVENKKQENEIKKIYYEFAKKNDEFDYIKNMDNIFIRFDSKENFENKYNGSWRAYFD